MKRYFALLAAVMILTLTGCAVGPLDGLSKTPLDAALFDVLSAHDREFFEVFSNSPPVSMTVRYDQVYPDATVEDADLINEMYDTIAKMRIRAETNLSITDAYNSVDFQCADGTSFGLSFEQHILCVGSDHYELTNDEDFWKLFAQIAEDYHEQTQENAS
ncbi:MAG: hypothetical protein VB021_07070 [Oscillospiraceae bacterium]|nr:hypothetical protein [Oscillospiraceae bacterium]